MAESYYGNEEYSIFKKRIRDEFAYLANNISDQESFLIEEILVGVIEDMLDRQRGALNNSMMHVIDRVLEQVCASVKHEEIYPTYISSLLQRIEMAKHLSPKR